MLVCMKPTPGEIRALREHVAFKRSEDRRSNAEIARAADVNPSQVSRICRGEFRTITYNVVQVCKELGIEMEVPSKPKGADDLSWKRLEASMRGLWDQTSEDAQRISTILDSIAEWRSN